MKFAFRTLGAYALPLFAVAPVGAQNVGNEGNAPVLEEVMVTGSNLATSSVKDGPVPITVLSSEDFTERGVTTAYEALSTQPFFGGQADNDTRAGAGNANQVNLRGLGSEYTLVLLNGRRVGSRDLNLVPFAAVERIEVVKDGASSVYGSDALAGVVNVILRDKFDGMEVSANYGDSTHYGDGGKGQISFIGGGRGEQGSFLLSGQYEKQDAILSLEHPLGASDDQRPWGGLDLRSQRRNPGLITLNNGSNVMLAPGFGVGQTGTSASDYVPAYSQLIDKRQPNNLQNDREAGTLYARGVYELADSGIELFGDFLYKHANVGYVDHRGTYLNYSVPASNYWNPFGQDVTVSYLLDYGTADGRQERPLETMQSDMDITMYVGGVRGEIGRVNYEIAYSDYQRRDVQSHDGLSRALILQQLARTDAGALNLFGNAAVTADQLAPARARFSRTYETYVSSLTGVARFPVAELPAGPLAAAVGFEFRKNGFSQLLDESLNVFRDAASLTFLNDSSAALSRSVDAYYAEVNIPLAGGDFTAPALQQLDLGLAVRHEEFSDFGNATVPRATLRWKPLADTDLLVRASYSESFYAPNLPDLTPQGDVNVDPYFDPLILDANGNPLRYDMETEGGGNPNLDASNGKYYNLGVVFSPSFIDGLTVSVDGFWLKQTDGFITPDEQVILNGLAPGEIIRSGALTPGDNYAGAPVGRVTRVVARVANAATRTVEGIDLDLTYSFDTAWGEWTIGSNSTYTTKFEYNNADGNGVQSALGKYTAVFSTVPRFRSALQLANRIGPVSASLVTNYVGGVDNTRYNNRAISSYVTSDLNLLVDFDETAWGDGALAGTTVGLTVRNLFDEDAPFYATAFLRGVATNYAYVDLVGQFVTLSLRKKF
jgi:outer membrane receptor protein involved in Fe transport